MGVDVKSALSRGWDEGGMQKKKRKLLKKGGREGENEDKRCDREVTKLCQLSAGRCEVRDVVRSCADPQAAGQCGWRLCSTSVASGHKSLRIFRPTVSVFLPRERWAATSPQRVWFFPSSRHGWSCQRNLSSLSPSGLLLGLDWRKWLHEFVLFVCFFLQLLNWKSNRTVNWMCL